MKRSLAICLLLSVFSPAIALAQSAPDTQATPQAQATPQSQATPQAQAAPQPQDAPAAADAKSIISRQIAALERDDAAEAYSYAAPQIQALFPDADVFLSMVAAHYAPVHRHRSVEFGPVAEEDGRMAETVIFTDSDGEVWNAIYKLEKQPEGGWKISGCVLAKSEEKAL